jgi:hypothetical protein
MSATFSAVLMVASMNFEIEAFDGAVRHPVLLLQSDPVFPVWHRRG